MRKFNLLESAPAPNRKIDPNWRTEENRIIAKRYDREFFDGDRINGYGGYYYDGRWRAVVKKLIEEYGLNSNSSVLDIGCAKGFLLFDLQDMIPGIKISGIDVSDYAISKAMEGYANYLIKQGVPLEEARKKEQEAKEKILPFMIKGSCDNLPYADDSFDVVLSINTAHNLPKPMCGKAIKEMIRVGKNPKNMFAQLDSYTTEEEKARTEAWVITAETMMYTPEWIKFLEELGYDGDYYWTII